jgi:hypothetical protein
MLANVKFWGMIVAISCIVLGQMTGQATALTAEIARNCNALATKAFPPRQVGNPAAGVKGGAKARQEYYRKCIENDGKMDHDAKETK